MSFVTTYKSSCGCVFDIEVASNWESGGIEIDDVCIVSICDKHCPTSLAPDGGDSPLEDSPFETGVRRGAVVTPPAAGKA